MVSQTIKIQPIFAIPYAAKFCPEGLYLNARLIFNLYKPCRITLIVLLIVSIDTRTKFCCEIKLEAVAFKTWFYEYKELYRLA